MSDFRAPDGAFFSGSWFAVATAWSLVPTVGSSPGAAIATRDDQYVNAFFSAICIAASVAFYLNQ